MEVTTYKHFLVDEKHLTPAIFEFLKKRYAASKERMCKNAEYMASLTAGSQKDTECWIAWMAECCEPCGLYYNILEMLKENNLITYSEEEINTCWGLLPDNKI